MDLPSAPKRSAHSTKSPNTEATGDQLLHDFFQWLLEDTPPGFVDKGFALPLWAALWAHFRADGTMSWPEFEDIVRWQSHWHGDAHEVFKCLDDQGIDLITTRALLEARRRYEKALDFQITGRDGLIRILTGQYGSLIRAWRFLFDPEEQGWVCHTVFVRCCHSLGFRCNLKTTWAELTKGTIHRTISLQDLDPEADRILGIFASALVSRHSSLRAGWTGMIKGAGGRMEPSSFHAYATKLGLRAKDSRHLFDCLDKNGNGSITEDDLHFLHSWDPSKSNKSKSQGESPGAGALSPQSGNELVAPFEFTIVLSPAEYTEYLRRKRQQEYFAGAAVPSPVGR